MKETMKDINGVTIKVGDFVLYAAASGSTATLQYAKVLKKTKIGGYKKGFQVGRANEGFKSVMNICWYERILVIKKSFLPAKIRKQLETAYA